MGSCCHDIQFEQRIAEENQKFWTGNKLRIMEAKRETDIKSVSDGLNFKHT